MEKPQYFDAHAHLNFPQYDEDREEVIRRSLESATFALQVGTEKDSSRAAVQLAEKHDGFWAAVGLHPTDYKEMEDNPTSWLEVYQELVKHPKVVAIGECGLDYFRLAEDGDRVKELQKEIFKAFINLAAEEKKALVMHCRPRKGTFDAYDDMLTILEEMKEVWQGSVTPIAHCYVGDWERAQKFIDLGCYLSFTGVITFTSDYDEVVKNTPLDRILSETDCPFLAPVPYRGTRNEPVYVLEVVKAIVDKRGEDMSMVQKTLVSNAFRALGLQG